MNKFLNLSVIIPSFNSGHYLMEAVESINNNPTQPIEIIIVDDCSSDGQSYAIAKNLESRFNNITVLKTPQNLGAMHARKLGITYSKQNYIFCLDADDYLESGALELAYMSIGDHGACLLDQWVIAGNKSWRDINLDQYQFPLSGKDAGALTLNGWQIHAKALIRKEIYLSAYQFIDHQSYANADEILTRYIIRNTSTFVCCNKKYMVRVNPNSTTRSLSAKTISIAYCFVDIYQFAHHYGYLNTKSYYEGYIWADAIKFFWFLRSKKKQWVAMGLWDEVRRVIQENLFKVTAWNAHRHVWKIDRKLFFKLKVLLRYYYLILEYK